MALAPVTAPHHPGLAPRHPRAVRDAARGHEGRYVTSRHLDPEGLVLLRRAQAAADAITGSRICREGIISRPVVTACLAEKEWVIASNLRKLTELRRARLSIPPAPPGGRASAEALARMIRIERSSAKAITSMVRELEASAADARDADASCAHLELGSAAACLADDLLASIAAHRQQSGRLDDLALEVKSARLALRELSSGGTGERPRP